MARSSSDASSLSSSPRWMFERRLSLLLASDKAPAAEAETLVLAAGGRGKVPGMTRERGLARKSDREERRVGDV
jgi:hypothetical protein